ncbi:MAG: hypothetical protein WAV09_00655 [Minisyncoccia bacterium]
MKEIIGIEQLHPKIYETIIDPTFSVSIERFCDSHSVSDKTLRAFIETKITNVAFGSVSLGDCVFEISNVLELDLKDEGNDVFTLILDLYDEDTISEILQYEVNQNSETTREIFNIESAQKIAPTTPQKNQELERNPQAVQAKLLQVLTPFNLHVDEEGIVAHEVERYLRGEVLAKDLVPHLSALLDKPLSEINALIESLNESIFKPIQKQIAEEGTLDISYDDDASLQNILVVSKKKGLAPSAEDTRKKIQSISFIPKEVLKNVSRQEKDAVAFDLRAQGGTPSGTSLLSQEILEEQLEKSIATPSKKEIASIPKYTIDPYRENI